MPTPETLIRFDRLRGRLIAGGVAGRHVNRTLTELRDHYDDAIEDGLAQGLTNDAAAEAAWRRLGHEDDLVSTVLARPELRSLPARFPRLTVGIGPVLLWMGFTIGSGLCLAALIGSLESAGMMPAHRIGMEPIWLQKLMNAVLFVYMRVLPILIGVGIAVIAARRHLIPSWTVGGAASVSLLSAFTTYAFDFPTVAGQSGSLSIGLAVDADRFPVSVALAATNAALILCVYWFARRRTR